MKRALVIDDEESILTILRRFLRELGFDVITSLTADEGLAFFYQDEYELVILDIHMPVKNGFTLAKEMRLTRPEQKILVITGLDAGQVYQHLTVTDADFDDILYKPFTFEKMKYVVERVLKESPSQLP